MKEFEGYKVLLADDEELDREVVSRIVEGLGAECVTAKDGDEALAMLNGPAGATHQKDGLEILCRAENLPVLMLDPHRLRQIAFNLMGNAIKFTKKGFIEIRTSFAPDATKFDFVLTDMWMPEMDGMKLVAAIRANPAVAKQKVYLFTAEVEMKDSYSQSGFDGIVLKPANLEALKTLLP